MFGSSGGKKWDQETFAIEQQRKRQKVTPAGPKQIADVVVVQDRPHIAPELQGEERLTRTQLGNLRKRVREKAAKEAKAKVARANRRGEWCGVPCGQTLAASASGLIA